MNCRLDCLLVGIMNHTRSTPGRQMLKSVILVICCGALTYPAFDSASIFPLMYRQWFLRPTRHIPTLNSRLDAIQFLKQPQNTELVKAFRSSLANIGNIQVRRVLCDTSMRCC